MKRGVVPSLILSLIFVAVVALSGCNRTPPTAKEATDSNPPPATSGNAESTFEPQTRPHLTDDDVSLLAQINRENAKVVAASAPSIVRITAMVEADPHAQFFGDLPFKFPGMPKGLKTQMPSYGAGVIISRDGYIVTNHHVIEDAQSVAVQLRDQRSFPAKIVASDEPSDVAVLKIAADGLPALPWGDSDKVQVGEQVFAIGNPFDLDDSVSKGIVSAKGRNLPDEENPDRSIHYEDYIQTDAAINVGNSGGALVNEAGAPGAGLPGRAFAVADRRGRGGAVGLGVLPRRAAGGDSAKLTCGSGKAEAGRFHHGGGWAANPGRAAIPADRFADPGRQGSDD
jgi:S1-C subfamily serine protease